jgi:hypothetical protein
MSNILVYRFEDILENTYWIAAIDVFEAVSFICDEIIEADEGFFSLTRVIDEEELNEKSVTGFDGELLSINEIIGEYTDEDIPCIICDNIEDGQV